MSRDGRPAGRAFARYVMVDWSASSTPVTGRDSIWVAVHDGRREVMLANPPTRAAAAAILHEIVDARPADPVLVGIDIPLGYPAGTAAALGLRGAPRTALWALLTELVTDDARNRNNRFAVAAELNRRIGATAGPFWGCPPSRACATLSTRKPASAPLAEFRACERALRERRLRPASVWQLAGIGSVGGQALVGIPVIAGLVAAHRGRVRVWPFDDPDPAGGTASPALGAGGAAVVVAEVWPTAFGVDLSRHPVRDAAQVRHVAADLARRDRDGTLAACFGAAAPGTRVAEEGAILAPPPTG